MALGHWLKDYIGPKDSGGSASIPTPTVEDAGKVLAVSDEGQYGLASAGGGGTEPLVLRYTRKEIVDRGARYYFDKTWQEVSDALTANRPVYIKAGSVVDGNYEEDSASLLPVFSAVTFTNPSTQEQMWAAFVPHFNGRGFEELADVFDASSADGYLFMFNETD